MIKRRKIFYKRNRLQNPFFQKRKGASFSVNFSLLKLRLSLILFIITFLLIIWALFFSSMFEIKTINVSGNIRTLRSDIEALVWSQTTKSRFVFARQKNLLLFDKDRLNNNLNQIYLFNKVEINKKLPGTLDVNVQEKSYAFVWLEDGNYYFADAEGYLIGQISPLDIKEKSLSIIQNSGDAKITDLDGVKKINTDRSVTEKIIGLYQKLKDSFEIEKFIIDNELNKITIKIVNGPEIYFDKEMPDESQIEKLNVLKNERLKEDFNKKTYIDLRFGDRIYYR